MKLTEQEAAALYRRMTARADGAGCLGEQLLLRAAANDLSAAEREQVSSHIARCSDCARDYQIARSMRSLPKEERSAARWVAIAAAVLLAVSVFVIVRLMRTNELLRNERTALLRQAADLRQFMAPPPTAVDLPKPQIGVPIVDLDSDLVRGGAEAVPRVVVPPTTDVFTLILHLPAPAGRTAVNVEIAGVWRGTVEVPAGSSSITLALHRRMMPAGSYTLRVEGARQPAVFRFDVIYP